MRDKNGETRTEWAYKTLKSLIMRGELALHTRYLEQDLADQLGISRTPVREAALRLQAEGFVTIRPRLGLELRPIRPEDTAEIYDVLTELEPYAASKIAARRLRLEEVARLEGDLAHMELAAAEDDRDGWALVDRRFHERLMELSGNRRILNIVSTLWDQTHRLRMAALPLRASLERSNEDHRRLVTLIREGDIQGAEHMQRRHRASAKRDLLRLLEQHQIEEV